jgi:hypothetical protein
MSARIQTKAELEVEFTADGLLHDRVVEVAGRGVQEAITRARSLAGASWRFRTRGQWSSAG